MLLTSLMPITVIIVVAIVIILSIRRDDNHRNLPIVLILIGFTFVVIQYLFFWTGYSKTYPFAYFFDIAWFYAFGPLFYVYLSRFYLKNFKINWLHFLAPILVFVLSAYYCYKTTGFTDTENIRKTFGFQLYWQVRNPWITILSFVFYWLIIKDFIQIYGQENKDTQSYRLREKWTNTLLRFFLVFMVAYTSYYVLILTPFFNLGWDYAISIVMAVGIYGIGFMAIKEPAIFNGELLQGLFHQQPAAAQEELSPLILEKMYQQLLRFIQSNKPYLDNDIRLVSLADQLGFSSHMLSALINRWSNKNFNQFINEYRLREAENLLIEEPMLSVKEVCYAAGFNNKVTFYSSFKRKHNCTPVEFRKKKAV